MISFRAYLKEGYFSFQVYNFCMRASSLHSLQKFLLRGLNIVIIYHAYHFLSVDIFVRIITFCPSYHTPVQNTAHLGGRFSADSSSSFTTLLRSIELGGRTSFWSLFDQQCLFLHTCQVPQIYTCQVPQIYYRACHSRTLSSHFLLKPSEIYLTKSMYLIEIV